MAKEIKGPQLRDLTAALALRKDEGKKSISFSASSTEPYDRWYGTEVLSHDSAAIRMDRVKRGAVPLLFNHNWDDPIGMVTAGRIDGDRLMVDADLFATDRAAEIEKMIDGGLRNVSIGYRVHEFLVNEKEETYTATDWEPLEISIVTVPADSTVGIGRAAEGEQPVRIKVFQPAAPAAPLEDRQMTTAVETPPAGQSVQAPAVVSAPADALAADRERCEAISNLCRAAQIDARIEQQWKEKGTSLSEVAKQIRDVQEARAKEKPQGAAVLGMTGSETQRYSIFKAVRALHYGARNPELLREAAFEIECSRAVAKQLGKGDSANLLVPAEVLQRPIDTRAMATTPGSKGGYLIATENRGFVDILRNRSVLMNMGATVLSGLVGNITIPRQTASPAVSWQAGDAASITAADQTFGQLSMAPKTAIAVTDVSEQLLRQSAPSAEALIMADLARVVALGVDSAGINGTGGAQPVGIKSTVGVTTGQAANAVDYAKVLAFVSTAAAANAILSNPGFVTNAAGAAILMAKQRFTSTDTPLWEGNMMDGSLVGFRAMASEQLAASNLIFGSWGEVMIGEWGVLELATDTGGTRFNTAQVGIRAMWMVDILVRYPQAFVVSTNLAAT